MKQILDRIPHDKDTANWVTHFCYSVFALKLLSDNLSQISRKTSNELLNAHKIFIDS